ncbi:leucine-rich repeats and immunoglobulin-like domains protein 3 isoform X2 [Aphidius gifuensis]|uniref:leucine-rich repeats and immunoglobulin-like domains protein 3 isoform X2 n=1 Tax=Aphidius gifuensis TaxID=684658 RepID=UPI001CDBFF73|nr:leucine-rich repeats and immunoglobulin-like domains protein 3 isoform X2 [Aphidius gifuensis]
MSATFSLSLFLINKKTFYLWFGIVYLIIGGFTNLPQVFGVPGDGKQPGGQCPVECACLGNVVDCSGLQLVGLPSGLPPWTEILELKDNSIVNLDFEAFNSLNKLKKLDISSNKLQDNFTSSLPKFSSLTELRVNKNSLKKLPNLSALVNLNDLTISHNDIVSIDGGVINKMTNLENLDLSNNRITILNDSKFSKSNKLTKLNLNNNEISDISLGYFDNLTYLEELRLNKNSIKQLVTGVFGNLTNLKLLELNRNDLQQIHGLIFKNLINLEELKLKRNKIDTIDDGAFWPLKTLIILQLDFNNLTVVKKGSLFGLDSLRKLTLSKNKISTIEPLAWEWCKEIRELDLSSNQLTSIDRGTFEYLLKLEKLKLDHNKITYISDATFTTTPSLQVLDLNTNRISAMIEDMTGVSGAFIPLRKLLKLGLAHNQIKSINSNAFNGLALLQELDLLGNNITSIQENAFTSIPQLSKLNMNTGALVCDCGLQWLSAWLREHIYSDAKTVRCGYPHWLKGQHLIELHHANFTCDEFPKPIIIEEPVSKMGIKGDNVTLTCRATSTADTPLYFTWKHENVEVRKHQVETVVTASGKGTTEATSTLNLVNVKHGNAGKYQCMVSNTYGTSYSAKAKINVLVYPRFKTIPHDIRASAGSTAKLECSAEGQPSPQIAWQKDGGNDFPAARERRMHMMPTDPVLFIVDVKTADSGVYSCTAQNLAGLIVANASLTILETPSFVKPMENKEIVAGGSVVLECMASGSPRPKLTWKKNNNPLQATERHFFTAEDQLLIIVNTIISDAGNYECEMSNSLGRVVGASTLTINPAPSTIVNGDDMLGLLVIAVVCCAVGTSIIWVVIIYQTRRVNASHNKNNTNNNNATTSILATTNTTPLHVDGTMKAQLYLDSTSQHSKDSGTGDSTNPTNDPLQLCLPEMRSCVINTENELTVTGEDPLLCYTNHQRNHKMDNHWE